MIENFKAQWNKMRLGYFGGILEYHRLVINWIFSALFEVYQAALISSCHFLFSLLHTENSRFVFIIFCFSTLASASADMTIKLWDFQGYENIKTLHGTSLLFITMSLSRVPYCDLLSVRVQRRMTQHTES